MVSNVNDIIRKISGIGIISGLEVTVGSDSTVLIKEGYGITSKGKLIYHPQKRFKYFRPFSRGIKGFVSKNAEVEVWEMLVNKEEDGIPLTPQSISGRQFLASKVMLLYQEVPDTDQSAMEHEEQVIPMMIDKEDLWKLMQQKLGLDPWCVPSNIIQAPDLELDTSSEDEEPNGVYRFFSVNKNTLLRPIEIMRFGHGTNNNECDQFDRQFLLSREEDEKEITFQAVYNEYKLLIDDLLVQLVDRLRTLNAGYESEKKDNNSEGNQVDFSELFSEHQRKYSIGYIEFLVAERWADFQADESKRYHIQYFWEFTKDLAKTYNEIVEEISVLMAQANLDEQLFPFHLLIGELQQDVSFGPNIYRTEIRQPAVFNDNSERLKKIRFLHWRMVMMIKCFYLPGVESNDIADNHYSLVGKGLDQEDVELPESNIAIRITPAPFEGNYVNGKTIPYYYYTAEDSNSILSYWSYKSLVQGKNPYLYSYHSNAKNAYTDRCSIKFPLSHEFSAYPFLRVEGHVGKTLNQALQSLYDLRKRNNVNFEIVAREVSDLLEPINKKIDDEDYCLGIEFLGSNFACGVVTGGTFILLYENLEKNGKEEDLSFGTRVIGDFYLPHKLGKESEMFTVSAKVFWIVDEANDATIDVPDVQLRAIKKSGSSIEEAFYTLSSEEGVFEFLLKEGDYFIQVIDEEYEVCQQTRIAR